MFRNGFNATRRSLLTVAHPRPLAIHKDLISSKFVCISCQLRPASSTSKQIKKGRGTKSETFLGAIKRLEAHVQHIERNYADRVRQQKALQELPDREITEEDKDHAYATLMAPPAPASFLPAPVSLLDQLPAPILRRIGEASKLLVVQERQEWSLMLAEIELNGGLSKMTTSEVNKMVSLIAVDQRAELSSKLLEMMKNCEVEPNTLTYDLMMLAHAAVGNPMVVKTLFEDMKERGLKPTVYSYAHLLKAHSQESDVQAATHAVQEMHALGIHPNLVVYTTLIQTCINRKQLETAWQIFNLIKLKSTSTAPDTETYTLMIHACAINGEVERALDLYTDMTDRRGLQPTSKTYHALIHACALRKDYFSQAWRFTTEMQRQGLTVNRLYLNTLVQACGRTGELTRARLLVRHMMQSGRSGIDMYPDEITFQNLLRAYATYKAPGEKKNRNFKSIAGSSDGKAISGTKEEAEPFFISTGTGRLEKRREGHESEEEVPFLDKGVLLTHKDVILEARQVFNWLREKRPKFIGTQLLNAYLNVCQNIGGHSGFREVKKCYTRYFSSEPEMIEESSADTSKSPIEDDETISDETAEDDEDLEQPSPPPPLNRSSQGFGYKRPLPPPRYLQPPRNIYTFTTALQAAYKDRDLTFARQIMSDWEKYKLTLSYQRIFLEERRKHEFYIERIMIDILAACEYLGEAVKRLEANLERFEWKEEHLKTLYVRAVQLEDWSTMRLCNKVAGKEENRY